MDDLLKDEDLCYNNIIDITKRLLDDKNDTIKTHNNMYNIFLENFYNMMIDVQELNKTYQLDVGTYILYRYIAMYINQSKLRYIGYDTVINNLIKQSFDKSNDKYNKIMKLYCHRNKFEKYKEIEYTRVDGVYSRLC